MGLSPAAVIGLVTLFIICAPSALLLFRWINKRKKKQKISIIEDASICIIRS
jgi:hypothetical protein